MLDTSEYPRSAVFGHTEDNVSSRLQGVINDLADEAPRPLGETIARFAASVARVVAKSRKDDTESESGGSDGYDAFEDYDDVGTAPDSPCELPKLQQYVDVDSLFLWLANSLAETSWISSPLGIDLGLFALAGMTLFYPCPCQSLTLRSLSLLGL